MLCFLSFLQIELGNSTPVAMIFIQRYYETSLRMIKISQCLQCNYAGFEIEI